MSLLLAFQAPPAADDPETRFRCLETEEDFDDEDTALAIFDFESVAAPILAMPEVTYLEDGEWNDDWPTGEQFIEAPPAPVVDAGIFIPTFRPRRGR